jgi:hypothetical protein
MADPSVLSTVLPTELLFGVSQLLLVMNALLKTYTKDYQVKHKDVLLSPIMAPLRLKNLKHLTVLFSLTKRAF